MRHRRLGVFVVTALLVAAELPTFASVQTKPEPKRKPINERVIDFCREQSTVQLKYTTTVEWHDLVREENDGNWLVSGVRTAKGPDGNVDQIFTCRVQMVNGKPQLRMIQLFHESTKTGKDVFQLFPAR